MKYEDFNQKLDILIMHSIENNIEYKDMIKSLTLSLSALILMEKNNL
jgi:hypothetical protein